MNLYLDEDEDENLGARLYGWKGLMGRRGAD